MLSLSLDLTRLKIALVGNDKPCARRLGLLEKAGARALTIFSAAPSAALTRASGNRLKPCWPDRNALRGTQLVFIADVPEPLRSALAADARAAGAILHVEDAPELSDSHAPAVLRRGALTIAVATDGEAPGVAVALRDYLGSVIGPEWHGRIAMMKTFRERWRRAGADYDRVRRLTAAQLGRYGWLNRRRQAPSANDRGAGTQTPKEGGR